MLKHWKCCGLALIWMAMCGPVLAATVSLPHNVTVSLVQYLAMRDVLVDPAAWVNDAVVGETARRLANGDSTAVSDSWARDAARAKANACKVHMRNLWKQKLTLPANDSLMVETVIGQPGYLNRAQRDSAAAQ